MFVFASAVSPPPKVFLCGQGFGSSDEWVEVDSLLKVGDD